MLSSLRLSVIAGAICLAASNASAGLIVVNHDEWTLSNTGFSRSPDASVFVQNLVGEFGRNLHAYSTNFGLTQSSLVNAMGDAGATYTTGTDFDFTAANVSAYDGLFLAGNQLDAAALTVLGDYVDQGGSVYIAGGTGWGGAAAEAAAWNSFLAPFDVQMGASYDGVSGNIAVSGDPIFAGVSTLYSNNGNPLSGDSVVCCGVAGQGQYAVARVDATPVAAPAALALIAGGLAAMAWYRRASAARRS